MKAAVMVGVVAAFLAGAQARAGAVQVRLSGAGPTGELFVQLCSRAEYGRVCVLRAKVAPHAGEALATFPEVAPGAYAVNAFQDVDGNGRLSYGLLGAPSEPWGYSRGAKGVRGPPAFKDAVITVGPGQTTIPVVLGR